MAAARPNPPNELEAVPLAVHEPLTSATVALPDAVNATGRPDDEVALTVKSASP